MKKFTGKLLSFVLTAAMIVTILPATELKAQAEPVTNYEKDIAMTADLYGGMTKDQIKAAITFPSGEPLSVADVEISSSYHGWIPFLAERTTIFT